MGLYKVNTTTSTKYVYATSWEKVRLETILAGDENFYYDIISMTYLPEYEDNILVQLD